MNVMKDTVFEHHAIVKHVLLNLTEKWRAGWS